SPDATNACRVITDARYSACCVKTWRESFRRAPATARLPPDPRGLTLILRTFCSPQGPASTVSYAYPSSCHMCVADRFPLLSRYSGPTLQPRIKAHRPRAVGHDEQHGSHHGQIFHELDHLLLLRLPFQFPKGVEVVRGQDEERQQESSA